MENQKDNWDILAINLGFESESETEQQPEKCETEAVPPPANENTDAVITEKPTVEKPIETAADAENPIRAGTGENDSFGAGILDKSETMIPFEVKPPAPVLPRGNMMQYGLPPDIPQDTAHNSSQRDQKKSFLGRFAKMTFFGTPAAKEPPPVHGRPHRHSSKAVTSFASKTVETADVPLNYVVKSESSATQNVQNTAADTVTADVVSEMKAPAADTKQSAAEDNPVEQLISQIESRSRDLKHHIDEQHREEHSAEKRKFPRRPPSMFEDEPAETAEVRALKNIIENEKVREDAEKRLNSIFNEDEKTDGQNRRTSPQPHWKEREPREQTREQPRDRQREQPREPQRDHRDRRDSRQYNSEERDYPPRSRGQRGPKYSPREREYVKEPRFQEEESGFTSWEEPEEVKSTERSPKTRGSRGSRSDYKQGYQERKREKRVISGHFSDDSDEFMYDGADDEISVDPVLVQAARTALGWDDAISGIIENNIRQHLSGGGNQRQNRR
ncbi:MAG: hypothetical protein FWE67_02915 [Planctomycetaceae bacterium]|nr:hypothetical protein [Planctomycetaceae bacterium]